jgi:hypothetical protein
MPGLCVTVDDGSCTATQVNGMLLEGKKVYVGPFVKRTDRPEGSEVRFTNVFVKNLADSVTEETLEGLFSKYGVVTSVVIMKVIHSCNTVDKTMGLSAASSFLSLRACSQHPAVRYTQGTQITHGNGFALVLSPASFATR